MASPGFRRRLVFFAVALLLPSAMLAGFGVVLIRQDGELEERRLGDRRALLARQWTDSLFAQLERAYSTAGRAESGERFPSGSVLLDLGHFAGGRALLNGRPPARSPLLQRDFQDFLFETARLETAQGKPLEAARRYDSRLRATTDPVQRAFLALRTARAYRAAGQRFSDERNALQTPALAALAAPDSLTDEFGVPIAYYAAYLLLEDRALDPVQERLSPAPTGLMTPEGHAAALDLAAKVSGVDSTGWAAFSRQMDLLAHVETRPLVRDPSPESPRWVADPTGHWLIRLVDGGRVEAEHIVAAAIDSLGRFLPDGAPLHAFRMGSESDPASLGGPFRGLAADVALEPTGREERRTALVGLVALFLVLALFSGFLLWRDVRRETQLAALRSQFVSSVSHELRTPLTSIRLYAESMRAFGSDDAGQRDKDLSVIANESDRLTRMLDNVLNTTRIERGTMRYRFELGDVSEPVDRAATAMSYQFGQEHVELNVLTVPAWTVLDADAVEQAVLNLLSNALKYGDRSAVDLACRAENGSARITVSDHGPGIAPEARERIFERFHREESALRQNIPGAGLGLALVRHIAEAHGGTVTVDSVPGDGSTFTLTLPIRES